jgi:hypothetical protein
MIKIKLLRDHEHGGVTHSAGSQITVDAVTAEWLARPDVLVGVVVQEQTVVTPASKPVSKEDK